ncbi:MAG TPA: MopE-related protein, partial [Ilumatobacteraceae bacterium]|nr:MopE-related protein [Ilumatobacteraceae bacterium]
MYPRNIRFLAATAAWALGVVGTAPALAQTDYRFGLRDEQVRVLGQDSGDELGSSIAIGDVTGDTIGDLVIGARQGDGRTNARADAGEVVVVAGGPLIPVSIRAGAAQTVIFGPSESANLGDAVAVGDLNGDGIGDIIMGAAKADAPERGGAGTVFVIYGRTDLDRSIDLGEDTADVRLYGTQVDGALGRRIVVGDFDADGVEDVAFSAPREGRQFARANAGVVYVFFGKRGLERGIEVYPSTTGGLPTAVAVRGPTEDARLGHALAAGDVNGDGIDDIVMTAAVPAPFGRIDSGDVFVVFGGPRLVEGLTVDLAEPVQVDLKILGPQPGDHFGQGLGTADVNGDGVADLLIGAPTAPFVPAILTGRAYAIFGRPFQPHTVLDMATDGGDVSLVGPAMGAELGASLAGGDMNGDGFDEWIVGSPGADTTRAGVERVGDEPAGHAYRILGRAIWSDLGVMGALSQGVRPGDRAGDVLALGDVSGDGVPDLAVAAPLYDGLNDQAKDSGAAYVLFGRVGAETPLPNCSDADGDGFRVQGRTCGPLDCNDTRADTYPTADELCTDGIDNNCDGVVDQDGIDADEDGWPGGLEARCSVLDCNDSNPAINPGAGEICGDQVDNDCNGFTDAIDAVCALGSESCVNCVDDDGDGIGDLYEDACQAQPVEFKEVMARKAKSDLRMARKLYATGRIYDAPFMSDPNVATKSMVLGLAFSADRQVCLNMAGGRWKKKTLIFRGTGT